MSSDDRDDRVELTVADGVATVWLHHPRRRNALTLRMYDQLHTVCARLSVDTRVRVGVLRGAANAGFTAGTDIREFAAFDTDQDGVDYEHRITRVLNGLTELPFPVVAAVDGPATGGGLALALCCDLVVATPDATFSTPIAHTLGNCLSPSVLARLYATLGRARTLRLLTTGELLSAQHAQDVGLVSVIAGRTALQAELDALTERLTRAAPRTLAAIKTIDRRLLETAQSVLVDDVYRHCYGSDDFREGVTAFLHKRDPNWHGT